MAGTDWKFFRILSISEGGGGGKETTRRAVSMANFSRVQDLTDRTIHEYTRDNFDHLEFPSRVIFAKKLCV